MPTQVWYRNPHLFIRECAELGMFHHAWDRGFAVKRRLDPQRYTELHLPSFADYRLLMVGDQGTAELRRGYTMKKPYAVYPTWDFALDSMVTLEELMANPVRPESGYPPDETPVAGQEHRVVVQNVPQAGSQSITRKFYRDLAEMGREYPECIVHVHGLYAYKTMFGMGFTSVDVDPRIHAAHGKVYLPNGRLVSWEHAQKTPGWVNVLGFHTIELAQPRMRCMFNMKSAEWAARHYGENFNFRVRGGRYDLDAFVPTKSSRFRRIPVSVGDRFVCDACSLSDVCKYYRAGGVCTIPGTDTATLAGLFKTNNADQIIDGLAQLIEIQIERAAEGRDAEKDSDEGLDPEVGRALKSAFESGVTLAKLLDPTRFSAAGKKDGAQGILNVPGEEINPSQLVSEFVRELGKKGIPPEKITSGMIEALMGVPKGALSGGAQPSS